MRCRVADGAGSQDELKYDVQEELHAETTNTAEMDEAHLSAMKRELKADEQRDVEERSNNSSAYGQEARFERGSGQVKRGLKEMRKTKKKVYYAHAMCCYGREDERQQLAHIRRKFKGVRVVNPARYDGHPEKLADTVGFCLKLVEGCDVVVFVRCSGR